MKKLVIFVWAALFVGQSLARDFEFSATCSSGQTLYYCSNSVSDLTVRVCSPIFGSSYGYYDYEMPKGNLIIPETVTHGGKTYIVTEINRMAFWGCQGITSITIPNSISKIGDDAFDGCTGLTSITIKSEANLIKARLYLKKRNISYRVISKNELSVDKYETTDSRYSGNVVIPSKITAGNTFSVVWIAPSAFRACLDLTSVAIPNSITRIGEGAFESCIHLTAIYCQAKARPSGWDVNWNPNKYKVVWGAVNKFQ